MVRIRMNRHGRRNRPFWRINVCDQRSPRDGGVIENLGYYDPLEKDGAKRIFLRVERIMYWLSKGAQPSERVLRMLRKKGIPLPQQKRARAKGEEKDKEKA